jgi:hypothetical protein
MTAKAERERAISRKLQKPAKAGADKAMMAE